MGHFIITLSFLGGLLQSEVIDWDLQIKLAFISVKYHWSAYTVCALMYLFKLDCDIG